MSDDEDAMMRGDAEKEEPKTRAQSSTSDDDDDSSSSSSGSGSSSSSDSSDSDSDGEGEGGQPRPHTDSADAGGSRKNSIESVASSNGRARGSTAATGEPLADVNSNRAAARFREQNSTVGLMALGTKKRDRRTIEEIQRDLLRRKAGNGVLGSSSVNGAGPGKPLLASATRPSPPKGSPALSPEPAGSDSSQQLATGLPPMKMPKGKPNSARSRLTMRLLGRGRPNAAPAPKPAAAKKPTPAASTPSTSASSAAGTGAPTPAGIVTNSAGMVTNISAAAKVVKSASSSINDLDSYVAEQKAAEQARQLEPRIEPKIVDWKPDGKVVRAILRGLQRFGDLTEVNMYRSNRDAFADELRLPNFVVRSNLPAVTKVPEERLLKTAVEIAERAQRAVEDRQDNMKFVDVETKPAQIIERLYENLKLRVAVQRALRDARYGKSDDKGAYVLVAKQSDLPTLGIARDFPPWHWAEKEHDWNSKKDTALLLGIYVHGFGAWEDILNDDLLHFHHQRALKGERMKKRAENLLKRLPAPDDAGEPRIVQLASAMNASSLNPNQSIGAHLSKIINNSNSSSTTTTTSNTNNTNNTGWLGRAAERHAARQSFSSSGSLADTKAASEDSIRRSYTQGGGSSNSNAPSSTSSSAAERQRKPSVTSQETAASTVASSSAAVARVDTEPEDGEVDASRATSTTPELSARSKSSTKKRSASIERPEAAATVSVAKVKKTKSKRGESDRSARKAKKPRLLSKRECAEKWEPEVLLKDVRQALKKMKIMASWSREQKDEVVVEKVYKYVTEIGAAIDKIVRRAEEKEREKKPVLLDAQREWDELCSCLWSHAAGFTPFSSLVFERLYDAICADGEALRQAASRPSEAAT